MTSSFSWFVGIDWGSTTHHVCLVDAAGRVCGARAFSHGGAGQSELHRWLVEQTGAAPGEIAVAIETPRGPVVEGLLVAGFAVHAIGPAQVRSTRRRYVSSGAKDDSRDAHMLARALRADPDLFRRLALEASLVVQLRERTRALNELTCQRTRLCHQIRQQLWRYYPQLLAIPNLFSQLAHPWFVELWNRAPTPEQGGRLRVSTLARLLKKHKIRRFPAARLQEILRAPALAVAPGTVAAACRALATLFAQAHTTNQLLAQAQQEIRELLDALATGHAAAERPHDLTLLLSLPGAGVYVVSTLFAEGEDLLRRRDYAGLRARSGVAPVTIQSGGTRWESRRLAVQHELSDAVYHWARVAMIHDPLSKARYRGLRAKGHSHGRALRTVGDRLLGVACAMLRNGTVYDASVSRAKLRATA